MAAFVKWYENEHFDPLALSVTQILDYLQSLLLELEYVLGWYDG